MENEDVSHMATVPSLRLELPSPGPNMGANIQSCIAQINEMTILTSHTTQCGALPSDPMLALVILSRDPMTGPNSVRKMNAPSLVHRLFDGR